MCVCRFQKLKCRLATCQVMSPNLCLRTTSKFITSRSSWTSSAKSNRVQTRYGKSVLLIKLIVLLYNTFKNNAEFSALNSRAKGMKSLCSSPLHLLLLAPSTSLLFQLIYFRSSGKFLMYVLSFSDLSWILIRALPRRPKVVTRGLADVSGLESEDRIPANADHEAQADPRDERERRGDDGRRRG